MPLLQFTGSHYFLTIPKKLVEAKGWKKGDEIDVSLINGDIVLRRVEE